MNDISSFNSNGSYNREAHLNLLREGGTPETPIYRPNPNEEYYTCTNDFYTDFMKPCWSKDPSSRPDFAILKEKFNRIRGKAKEYLLLDKQEVKKFSRSSASSVRTIEMQQSQLSKSVHPTDSSSFDSPYDLSPTQIHATRNFDALDSNYSYVSTNQQFYESQESQMSSLRSPSMLTKPTYQLPSNQSKNSDTLKRTSTTHLKYTRVLNNPTRILHVSFVLLFLCYA